MLAPRLGMPSQPAPRPAAAPCLRPFRAADAPLLARHANAVAVAEQMHDAEPREYTARDAELWIEQLAGQQPQCHYAIALGEELAGAVSLVPGQDIYAHSAEISYWVAEPHWGRGLATFAVREVAGHALGALGFRRLFARVFAGNVASQRVLEKCGFELEGFLRQGASKNGRLLDLLQYSRLA